MTSLSLISTRTALRVHARAHRFGGGYKTAAELRTGALTIEVAIIEKLDPVPCATALQSTTRKHGG